MTNIPERTIQDSGAAWVVLRNAHENTRGPVGYHRPNRCVETGRFDPVIDASGPACVRTSFRADPAALAWAEIRFVPTTRIFSSQSGREGFGFSIHSSII